MSQKNPFAHHDQFLSPSRHLSDYNGRAWGVQFDPSSGAHPVHPGISPMLSKRFLGFLFCVLLVVGVLYAKIAQLQVMKGEYLLVAAEENRIRLQPIKAPRGILFDRYGEQLVRNIANLTLELVPSDLPPRELIPDEAITLSSILGEDAQALSDELLAAKKASFQPMVFRNHLPYEATLKLRLAEQHLPGLRVVESASREYLSGTSFSHILGYTGKISETEYSALHENGYQLTDEIGKNGIESAYETALKGRNGTREVEVDARGKEQRVVASLDPVIGENIYLSIDAEMQRRAQQLLDDQVKKTGALGAAIVALDPRNGEVIALASSPAYDNNDFVRGLQKEEYDKLLENPMRPLFNRALAGQYPPGSTIKPLIASSALQEHIINPKTTVNSTGGIRIGQWFFPDWKSGGHGITGVQKAIAESVNTFFYMVGGGSETFTGLGIDRLTKYLEKFGLGKQTGIDLPGERRGFLPSPEWKEDVKGERWYIGDTYHLSIGQGDVLVTPLQMAVATSVIANGGKLYRPHLAEKIGTSLEKAKPIAFPIVNDNVIDANYLDSVREGMHQAVLTGSARALHSLPVDSAGKTGTAQFGPQKKTHAWFTTFAPYTDPHLVLAVIIEGGGEGHAAALPVAKELYQWYFSVREPSTTASPP